MRRRIETILVSFFIITVSLFVVIGDASAFSFPFNLPDVPKVPTVPRKNEPPRLGPTNTPKPEPTKEGEPTSVPASPTTVSSNPTATSAPSSEAGIGGEGEGEGGGGEQPSEAGGQPVAAPAQVGEVKALAAASGEDNLETLVAIGGVLMTLTGLKLVWPKKQMA